MAIFIPEKPKSRDSQGENRALTMLEKLSDDWFVFHSVAWAAPKNYKKAAQGEIDLLVFHPQKGILIIEVKGGTISTEKGKWFSLAKNGAKHEIKNPVQQASDNKHAFRQHLKERLNDELLKKLVIGHAVWFPDCASPISHENYPLDWKPQWTLFNDAVYNPEAALSVALDVWYEQITAQFGKTKIERKLTREETEMVVQATAPTFSAIPVHNVGAQLREMRFVRLTENQNRILDYIEDADYIAVYGSAGTGKTLLAAEMCRRFAAAGEKTLFLCYNRLLKNRVEEYRKLLSPEEQKFWDVFTFDGLALTLCALKPPVQSNLAGWQEVKNKLLQHLKTGGAFPYQHVVVDEAQDFQDDWLKALKKRALNKFVVFYDPQQLVYDDKSELPKFFESAEIKLKLPYNMRNTAEIAQTGYSFARIKPKLLAHISGPKPKFYVYENENTRIEKVREVLQCWRECYTPQSIMVGFLGTKPAQYKLDIYKFADGTSPIIDTVLRMKGLEAAAVILPEADLSKLKIKTQRNKLYVAATRARHELAIFIRKPDPNVLKLVCESYEIEFLDDVSGFSSYFEGELID